VVPLIVVALLVVIAIALCNVTHHARLARLTPEQRGFERTMKLVVFGIVALMIISKMIANASAEPQTRFYDARGNSIGTAVPQGEGSTRYYDAGGRSLGTSTTTHGTTTFYSSGGNVTGRASGGRGR
jgi:hypothetical protein